MTSETAGKYPQESYATGVRAIQLEWIFLQRVTWDTGNSFRGSGEDDSQKLFASSFFRKYEKPLPHLRSYKYDAGQEIRTGTPESSEVISG